MVQEGNIEDWRKAGQIAKKALLYGGSLIKPGVKAYEVCDAVENKIRELGGEIAFPVQVSSNQIAAHFCPDKDDPLVFDDQLVCLDVGAHVNGCIGDNALTVDLSGQWSELVKASKEALANAIKTVGVGVRTGEVGKVIKETIESYGFSPIHNLSGHGMDVFRVHTAPSMPNYDSGDDFELEEGRIIAIEPFATNGAGMIQESSRSTLFSFINKKPVRSPFARDILKSIEKYNDLPFTTRWLDMPKAKVQLGLRELVRNGVLRSYPPLTEKAKGMVSQAENTILVGDKVEILTSE